MTPIHIIRLRGPWDYQPLARFITDAGGTWQEDSSDGLPAAGRQLMPGDWSGSIGADFIGRVRFERAFHCPTNLAAGDRVDLVVEQVETRATVALNDASLGRISAGQRSWRAEITRLLRPRNRLSVVVECRGSCGAIGGLVGEVRLEIRTAGDV
ncbi:MAG: hypothetical protein J5I93_28905 [Pirellulaceae bacterium]|nr:hypothetical protein [Pirellulaceae bacterium]